MNTEFEVLKKIFQARNGVSIKLISNHLGFGVDYIRFICKKLEEKWGHKTLPFFTPVFENLTKITV